MQTKLAKAEATEHSLWDSTPREPAGSHCHHRKRYIRPELCAHTSMVQGNSNHRFPDPGPQAKSSEVGELQASGTYCKTPQGEQAPGFLVQSGGTIPKFRQLGEPKTLRLHSPQEPQSNSRIPVFERRPRGTYQRICGAEHWAAEQERQAGCDPGGPHRHRLGPRPSGQPPPALVIVGGCRAVSGRAAPPTPRPRGPRRPGGPRPRSPVRGPYAEGERENQPAQRREGGRREGGSLRPGGRRAGAERC